MNSETDRLDFLVRVASKEAEHLLQTSNRLFNGAPVTQQAVVAWTQDPDISERLDAFVARFGRLQDTLGDKLIPRLLSFLGEPLGPAIDNLDKAERFGWLDSADEWVAHRKIRNQMIHEYIEDPAVLADALETARLWVEPMVNVADRLSLEVKRRTQGDERL